MPTETESSPVIAGVETAVYTVPTDTPEADGTLAWDQTSLVLVTVRGGGETGIGWSYASGAAKVVVDSALRPVVAGRAALDIQALAEDMSRALRNIGRPGIGATALSAVDIALWDLKARLLGVPLTGLLGRAHDRVPVYGSGGFTSYDDGQTARQLAGWVEHGQIPRVKIKIGESWGRCEERDLHRVALAREIIGPVSELYTDANGGYRPARRSGSPAPR